MKQRKNRLWSAALPKALLPDPDSLLHHIDRAMIATEYARASQFLSNVPPGPPILSSPSAHYPPTSGAAADEFNLELRKAGLLLPSAQVEDFLNKVTTGEGRESSRHTATSVSTTSNSKGQTTGSSSSETIGLMPHLTVVENPLTVTSMDRNASTKSKVVNMRSDLLKRELSVDFPQQPQPVGTASEMDFNSESLQAISSGVVPNFLSAGPRAKCKSNDTRLERDARDRLKVENPDLFSNSVESSPNISGAEWQGIFLPDTVGPLELDRKYDAAAADHAYRAGSAAMEKGDSVQAIAFLRLASIKCPPDKLSAISKIGKLIAAAHELEVQETSRNVRKTAVELESSAAEQAFGRDNPKNVFVVRNMLKADEAYRAGVAALEAGKPTKALEHLQKAIEACPEDRQTAAGKIQDLIEQANFELRLG